MLRNTCVVPNFLVRKGISSDDLFVEVARDTVFFRRYGRELVSKPAISLKKKLEELRTVEFF